MSWQLVNRLCCSWHWHWVKAMLYYRSFIPFLLPVNEILWQGNGCSHVCLSTGRGYLFKAMYMYCGKGGRLVFNWNAFLFIHFLFIGGFKLCPTLRQFSFIFMRFGGGDGELSKYWIVPHLFDKSRTITAFWASYLNKTDFVICWL